MDKSRYKPKFSLRKKLFLFVVAIVVGLLAVVYIVTLRDERIALQNQLRARGNALARMLAGNVRILVANAIEHTIGGLKNFKKPQPYMFQNFDPDTLFDLGRLLSQITKDEDIVWGVILDPFGRVIVHSNPDIEYMSKFELPGGVFHFIDIYQMRSAVEEKIYDVKDLDELKKGTPVWNGIFDSVVNRFSELNRSEVERLFEYVVREMKKENEDLKDKLKSLHPELRLYFRKHRNRELGKTLKPFIDELLGITKRTSFIKRSAYETLKSVLSALKSLKARFSEEMESADVVRRAELKMQLKDLSAVEQVVEAFMSNFDVSAFVQFYTEDIGGVAVEFIDVSYPLLLRRGDFSTYVGEIHIGMSQRSILYAIRVAEVKLQFAALVAIAAGIVFTVILVAFITKPIKRIVNSMRRLGEEGLSENVKVRKVKTGDEIQLIAESFNEMVDGLIEKEKMRDVMNKVVSKEIAEELMKKGVQLGGERRFVTLLFSDIRGFTAMSEKMEPEEIVAVLNEYMNEMVKVVEKYGGVVDKFVGDEIMVIYGAPISRGEVEDAKAAVRTAVGMIKRLKELNEQWRSQGKREIFAGIGLNSGYVVAGNMGSEKRLSYTVIGDTVNTAARLCGAAGKLQILISQPTYELVKDIVVVNELEPIKVKGKSEPLRIYEVIDVKEEEETSETEELEKIQEAA